MKSTLDPATAAREAARALAPEIRERAREGEQLRALGGLELDPATIVRIIEDGSVGWTTLIGGSTAFFAWLEPEAARELIAGRPYGASTCMIAPSGSAMPDGTGGQTISGRWAFNTGIRHARFLRLPRSYWTRRGTEDG